MAKAGSAKLPDMAALTLDHDHRTTADSFKLERFPHITEQILSGCERSTKLVCRQASSFLRSEADKALADIILSTDVHKGVMAVKAEGHVLPCFHPDSSDSGKGKAIAAALLFACTAWSHYLSLSPLLLEHATADCMLVIYGVPLDPGHLKFPTVKSLQLQLDLRKKSANTASPTVEHANACVAIDLHMPSMEPTHWWKLIPFLRQGSIECAHIWAHGQPRMSWLNLGPCIPLPGQRPEDNFAQQRSIYWHIDLMCPELDGGGPLDDVKRAAVRRSLAFLFNSPDERIDPSNLECLFDAYPKPSAAVLQAEAEARALAGDDNDSDSDDGASARPPMDPEEIMRGCAQQ